MECIMLAQRSSAWPWRTAFLLVALLASSLPAESSLRHLHVGDPMPAFSLADPNGTIFNYGPRRSGVLGLVILQAKEANLERLVADLETLARTLPAQIGAFDCVGVMSGPAPQESLRVRTPDARAAFPIILDPDFSLWGQLGVIAAPTAVVVGADHKIQWVKAGYGYDFVAGFHAQLAKALGRRTAEAASAHVETLENTSGRARRDRHIQLARTLAKKGRWDAAVKELETLHQADPNAVEVALELGEILCRAGQNEAALKLVSGVKGESNPDKTHALWICAWAKRQMADLATAEALLTKALELDRESPRILYELGQVHQAKGSADQALACYRRALAGVFGDADVAGVSQK